MFFQTSSLFLAASLMTMVSAGVTIGWASNADCSPYNKDAEGSPIVDTCYDINEDAPEAVFVSGLPDGQSVQFYSGSGCTNSDDLQLVAEVNSQGCLPTGGDGISQYKLVNQS